MYEFDIEDLKDYVNGARYDFSYQECQRLYVNFGLGKKIVNALPKLSLSSKREIIIGNAPDEVKERFIKTCSIYKIDRIVLVSSILSRIYGMSCIFVNTDLKDDKYQGLTKTDLKKCSLYFKVLTPLAFKVEINQDPLSIGFQEPSKIQIKGASIDKSRAYVVFNGLPIYLDFQNSAFNFAGQSVFANMRRFIVSWVSLYSALERIGIKASAILIKNENGGFTNPQDIEVAKQSVSLFKRLRQGMVAFLGKGQSAEFFNLNGGSEISDMIREVKEGMAQALEDTPTAILLDKNLSNGLSEGSEDMKAIVMAVNNYRENYLNDIYNFLDGYMFYEAWDDDFIKEMKLKYSKEYSTLGVNQIRQMWIKDFKFKWGSVYPKTPDEETKEKDGVLDRLKKAGDIGVSKASLQEILNNSEVFGSDVEFNDFDEIFGMMNDENENGDNETKENI